MRSHPFDEDDGPKCPSVLSEKPGLWAGWLLEDHPELLKKSDDEVMSFLSEEFSDEYLEDCDSEYDEECGPHTSERDLADCEREEAERRDDWQDAITDWRDSHRREER